LCVKIGGFLILALFKKVLGIGLTGRILVLIDKYKDSYTQCNFRHILCKIHEYNTVKLTTFYAYCDDPWVTSESKALKVHEKKFKSTEEALGYIVRQIRITSKDIPGTFFYRSVDNGEDVLIYREGEWESTKYKEWDWWREVVNGTAMGEI
jgi:hypothetical protein